MQILSLSGKTTELYPMTKRTVELLNKEMMDRIVQWRMFSAKWELQIKDYYGKEISYKGIKYHGSPELVFWSYFPPFFDHEIPKILNQVSITCKEKMLPQESYVIEAGELLKIMTTNLWHEIAKTHQLLKGNGFPKEHDLKNVDGYIKSAAMKIDDEIKAILLVGSAPESTSELNEDMIDIKPNIAGIGVNLNAVWRWFQKKRKGM